MWTGETPTVLCPGDEVSFTTYVPCVCALSRFSSKVPGFSCQHRADLSSPVVIPAGYSLGSHTPGTPPPYRLFARDGTTVPGPEFLQSGRTVALPASMLHAIDETLPLPPMSSSVEILMTILSSRVEVTSTPRSSKKNCFNVVFF